MSRFETRQRLHAAIYDWACPIPGEFAELEREVSAFEPRLSTLAGEALVIETERLGSPQQPTLLMTVFGAESHEWYARLTVNIYSSSSKARELPLSFQQALNDQQALAQIERLSA